MLANFSVLLKFYFSFPLVKPSQNPSSGQYFPLFFNSFFFSLVDFKHHCGLVCLFFIDCTLNFTILNAKSWSNFQSSGLILTPASGMLFCNGITLCLRAK